MLVDSRDLRTSLGVIDLDSPRVGANCKNGTACMPGYAAYRVFVLMSRKPRDLASGYVEEVGGRRQADSQR